MKLNELLTEWDDWNDWDDLSGHHRAGASEARREGLVDDIRQYLEEPIMKEYIEKKYPRVFGMGNMHVVADQIAFTRIEDKNIIDWMDEDDYLSYDDFEDMVDEALGKLEHTLSID